MTKGLFRSKRGLIIVGLVVTLLAPLVAGAFKYLREGMAAPKIIGTDLLSGERVATEAWLAENMVVVVFWATWSPRSLDELRDLKKTVAEFPDLPFRILAVNADGQTLSAPERDAIVGLVTELDLPFPVIIDEGLEILYQYGVMAMPSTAIIDSTGTLRFGPSGYSYATHDLIVDSIMTLLGLAEPREGLVIDAGYRPNKKAGRYCNMALQQFLRRQYEQAIKNLDMARAADSGFAQPYTLRGEIYLELDSLDLAIEAFGQAVGLDSGSVPARTGLGIAFLRSGQLGSARAGLNGALTIDSEYTPAVLNLGLCLAELGDTVAAFELVEKARDLNERDPQILYVLGQLHMNSGGISQAALAYRSALEIVFPAP